MRDAKHPAIERLDRTSADLVEREHLLTQLVQVTDQHEAAAARRDELESTLEAEERDVARLERPGLRRALATVRGSRDTDLDRERSEVDSAASAFVLARQEADDLWVEVVRLRQRVAEHAGAAEAYERALAQVVEAAGNGTGPAVDPEVVVRARNIMARRRERVEVEQAVAAGRTARGALAQADATLRSASSWSDWDTFGGGGLISSSIKHDRMREAQRHITAAQSALARYAAELDDLGLPGIELPMTDGTTRTVDIWFDNIFTDLHVRDRIQRSQASVREVLGKVVASLSELEVRRAQLVPRGPLD